MKSSKLILLFFSYLLVLPKFGIATDFVSTSSKLLVKDYAHHNTSQLIFDLSLLDIEDDDEADNNNKKTSHQNVSILNCSVNNFICETLTLFSILNPFSSKNYNCVPRYKLNSNFRI